MSPRLRIPACIAAVAVAAGGLMFVAAPAHAAGSDLLGPSVYSYYTPSDTNGDGVVGDVGDTMKVVYQLSNDMDQTPYTQCALYATLVGANGVDVPFTGAVLQIGSSAYKSWTDRSITGGFTDTFYGSCKDAAGWHAWQATSVVWTPSPKPVRSLSITGSLTPMDSNLDGVVGDAGDRASVTYSVTNTGTQTLTAPRIASAGGALTTTTAITPGSTIQAQTSYTLRAGTNDLSASATATTTTPDAVQITSPSWGGTFKAAASPKRALSLGATVVTSDSNGDGVSGDLGDSAQAVYAVLNIGDQTLGVPTVATGLFGNLSGTGSIAPGNQQQVTKPFTITDASSSLSSPATASATTITGDNISITSEPTTLSWTAAAAPVRKLELARAGDPTVADTNQDKIVGDAGDAVTYPIVVTNAGSQALGQVLLRGAGSDDVAGAADGIGAGAQQSLALVHTITATEVAAGRAQASATATARTTTPDNLVISSTPLSLRDVPTQSGGHGGDADKPTSPTPGGSGSSAPNTGAGSGAPGAPVEKAIPSSFGFGFGPAATGGMPKQWPTNWVAKIQKVATTVPTITSSVKAGEKLTIATPVASHTVLEMIAKRVNGHTVTSWKRVRVAPKYQWYAGGKKISGATHSALTLTATAAGKSIVLKVNGKRVAIKVAVIASRVGATLTAHVRNVPAGAKVGYQWYANGKALKTGTKAKFTVPASLRGKKLTVKFAVAAHGYAITSSKASAATTLTAAAPRRPVAGAVTVTISTGASTKVTVTH